MRIRIGSHLRLFSAAILTLACFLQGTVFVQAQTETTGAFRGRVVDESGAPLPDATVRATNKLTGVPTATKTTADGYFTIGLLQPGDYTLTVLKGDIYDVRTRDQRLTAVDATTVLPEPFVLRKRTGGAIATQATPVPTGTPDPTAQPTPTTQPSPLPATDDTADVAIDINRRNPRRGGVFTNEEVSTLPLGATTLTRSFDELALLLPGVAPPPQTLGNIAGPGVGPGVGSAGQFAVNGLRSRSNNFTVDGSDNNDEDIGVRRQGFFALVPQPIESIQEYQVTTLLAPAQYGRNIGAQVNAVSKSGGNVMHGTLYGFLNSSQLNARNTFDFVGTNTRLPLTGRPLNNDLTTFGAPRNVFLTTVTDTGISTQQLFVNNNAGRENSFTLVQGGFVLGGPLIRSDVDNYGSPREAGDRRSLFYFISAEGMVLNANQEESFAVPTVEERGIFRTGARGLFFDPLFADLFPLPIAQANNYPTTLTGDALFSFFPFPNEPGGIYGRNTFTTVLPANAQGKILSGKLNAEFSMFDKPQEFVARYNFTDDWRDIPVTGGALFSTLRPRVRTQNLSTFLNTNLTGASGRPIFNQLRASYGRTRLVFDEVRDQSFLLDSQFARSLRPEEQSFLLNARTIFNNTLPGDTVISYARFISNIDRTLGTTESDLNQFGSGLLTPVGQINVAGFSPIGVDVFNFPQRRVNNTYQLADTLTTQFGSHSVAFGADVRRTELNSDLPRNARPLLTFNAFPNFAGVLPLRNFFSGADLAAVGAPSGAFQALNVGRDATINLRYYQLNFFGQDEWRIRENFYLSFGLRYEYNTVPKSANQKIERTFGATLPVSIRDLAAFIAGRRQIFEPDKNNFAPRLGIAYSPKIFGDKLSVFRAGAGIYYDQILGAVVSQSRNVFDTFLNTNFAGGLPGGFTDFNVFTPNLAFITCGGGPLVPLVQPGTLNTLNPAVPLNCFTNIIQATFPSGFPSTLPARNLDTPTAYHYAFTFEQQLSNSLALSAAYVGTQGRHLLRQTTPNQGSNALVFITDVDPTQGNTPVISGQVRNPLRRPLPNIGGVTIFTSDANSRYDALQLQMRGRYGLFGSSTQFQASYTFSKVEDDVSDVFDMAGAPALPQNSQTFAGERAPANFDTRHRFSYNYITDLSNWFRDNAFGRFLFKGTQIAGDGFFQTGQPFTVNTIFDVNLDGNLTDRLDNTNGIIQTGDRARPLIFNGNPPSVLANLGQDGRIPRNSFRAGNLWLTNMALIKNFDFGADNGKRLTFRMDVFNVFNRANYGLPVRYLEFPGFGQATDTVTPGRRFQFALKYSF